jgi:hypothetical protein
MVMKLVRVAMLASLAAAGGGCATVYPNPANQYVQRTDTVTFGAGNAQDVNAAAQIIDPWPPYVGNRRISSNGTRMAGAVERYQGGGRSAAPGGSPNLPGGVSPSGTSGAPQLFPLSPITPGPGGSSSLY